ncbi:MAG: helix-hairpin-helix domain-containing protein [Sulfurovum sp.]
MTKMIYKAVSILVLTSSLVFSMSVSELNVASKSELLKINGIGAKKADAIIKYRRAKPFIKISDVEGVKGVGKALANNIKNDVHKKKKITKSKKVADKKEETKKTTTKGQKVEESKAKKDIKTKPKKDIKTKKTTKKVKKKKNTKSTKEKTKK